MATRKRVILTLDSKVKVIRQHEKCIGPRQLAAEFGVGKTQINNIVTAKADILKLWDDGVNGQLKLVAVRKCPYVDLNEKVFDWFCSARARNIPLTGRAVCYKRRLVNSHARWARLTALVKTAMKAERKLCRSQLRGRTVWTCYTMRCRPTT